MSRPVRQPLPSSIAAAVCVGAFVGLFVAELHRPLRRSVEPKLKRNLRNLAVAATAAASVTLFEQPVAQPLSRAVGRRRFGVLPALHLPPALETAAAVILMDYTLYWWHVLTHRVPWLWRFHAAHHVDLDLDASTALRFHFGELTQSVAFRAAQISLIGVDPFSLSLWQTLLFASILFHHSNLRLPLPLERRLNWLIVTPRMHGIHHSAVRAETDSNWSSGLTLWDRLHHTLCLDVPQQAIAIGLPAYRSPEQVTLPKVLAMPFVAQPHSMWEPDVASASPA